MFWFFSSKIQKLFLTSYMLHENMHTLQFYKDDLEWNFLLLSCYCDVECEIVYWIFYEIYVCLFLNFHHLFYYYFNHYDLQICLKGRLHIVKYLSLAAQQQEKVSKIIALLYLYYSFHVKNCSSIILFKKGIAWDVYFNGNHILWFLSFPALVGFKRQI